MQHSMILHHLGIHVTPHHILKNSLKKADGGLRNPCIIKYPGVIEPGSQSHKMISSVDILPTICAITQTKLPGNEIDGENVWDLVLDRPDAINPHDYYPFSTGNVFEGVISADGFWKLHLPHSYRLLTIAGVEGFPGEYENTMIDTSLFDLVHDPYEKGNVLSKYPKEGETLKHWAEQHKARFFPEQE